MLKVERMENKTNKCAQRVSEITFRYIQSRKIEKNPNKLLGTMRFWNNHHQVRSKSKEWKTKQISVFDAFLKSQAPKSKEWKTKQISVHDAFLKSPSGTFKVERLKKNQINYWARCDSGITIIRYAQSRKKGKQNK
jgi:hypothetical protein